MSKKYLANLYAWTRGSEAIDSVRVRVAPVGGSCAGHLIVFKIYTYMCIYKYTHYTFLKIKSSIFSQSGPAQQKYDHCWYKSTEFSKQNSCVVNIMLVICGIMLVVIDISVTNA